MIKKREKENDLVVKAAGSEQSFLFLIKDNNLAFDEMSFTNKTAGFGKEKYRARFKHTIYINTNRD